jgi:hypothetical protein
LKTLTLEILLGFCFTNKLFLYLSRRKAATVMSNIKHAEVIVLVILSGLLAYRLLKHKRSGIARHRVSIVAASRTASIQSIIHCTIKKRLAKLQQVSGQV